jgi:hypothetical protein
MNLGDIGRLMVTAGAGLAALGLLLVVGSHLGLGRFPGDLSFGDDNVHVYLPVATCLLVSVIATVVINIFLRR